MRYFLGLTILTIFILACRPKNAITYDTIIRNGTIYNGSGADPFQADVGILNDTIAAIGNLEHVSAKKEIDATGLAVAPGFINVLSWADQSLLKDGRSMSDIKQGVTLEIFGEGYSPGPIRRSGSKTHDSLWTSLDGYFKWAMTKGVSPNIASFVGATSVRIHELDQANRAPSPAELERMKKLVAEAMEQGAMGLATSLIYAPANYASTKELIELSKVAASYGGIYITHMRSEGDFIMDAVNETFRIGREANIPVEIYHLKINIQRNWNKIDSVLNKIDSAQKAGMKVTANMYPYIASGTGLTSRLPTWVQEGGGKELRKRLANKSTRAKVLYEMEAGIPYKNSDPSRVVIAGFRNDSLNRLYKGKRLDDVARLHGKTVDETTLDLIVKDKSRVEAIYYLQSEDNVRRIIQLPYVSFGSDAGSISDEPMFKDWGDHPRAFGTFSRVLGKYVRDEKLISLPDAIRRMTSLPAKTLGIQKRGMLKEGFFADIAVFDAAAINDQATFESPRQYATGMQYVIVNGVPVLENGRHTGAKPGRVVRGRGYKR